MNAMPSCTPNPRRSFVAHLAATVLLLVAFTSPATLAQSAPPTAPRAASAPAAAPGDYSPKGADTCLSCHDEEADTDTFSTAGVFRSRHAHRGNPRAPFGAGGLQCEACHGPGALHSVAGKALDTINSQKHNSRLAPAQRNQPCLACHRDNERKSWHAGAHARADLACADCHRSHVRDDPVKSKLTQAEVCYACHKQQRADFQKASSHPVRQGRMACTDCHNAHGASNATASLVKPTLNQTCTSCHAEKRGPVLWEHAPVAEDCSLCHATHGSVRPALLDKSTPMLCQQCHSQAAHPSVTRTPAGLPGGGGGGAIFLAAGSCTNCHSQVHGSNHPAGAKLMR
jgi:DmsE family decaheme c-type cytochrome